MKVFVTGITGKQGGAVARHLVEHNFSVTGLTRNRESSKAEFLKSQGIYLVQGNLNHPDTYKSHLENQDAIFFAQALQGKQNEIRQGKLFFDSIPGDSKAHIVYSSVLGSDQKTGIPHFESKYELEEYLKNGKFKFTILRPGSFYENHLFPRVAKDIRKGKYISPLNLQTVQQMIGVNDIGKIAVEVMRNSTAYEGKIISLATDEKSIEEVKDIFSKVMGQPMIYKKLPGIIARLFMGKDVAKMFKFFNANDFKILEDIVSLRNEFGIEGDFESWAADHFGK